MKNVFVVLMLILVTGCAMFSDKRHLATDETTIGAGDDGVGDHDGEEDATTPTSEIAPADDDFSKGDTIIVKTGKTLEFAPEVETNPRYFYQVPNSNCRLSVRVRDSDPDEFVLAPGDVLSFHQYRTTRNGHKIVAFKNAAGKFISLICKAAEGQQAEGNPSAKSIMDQIKEVFSFKDIRQTPEED